jgi:hypothetical protein
VAVFGVTLIATSLFVGLFNALPAWAVMWLDLLLYAGMVIAIAVWSTCAAGY